MQTRAIVVALIMLERDIGVRLSVYGLSFIDSHGPRDLTMGDIASDFE